MINGPKTISVIMAEDHATVDQEVIQQFLVVNIVYLRVLIFWRCNCNCLILGEVIREYD